MKNRVIVFSLLLLASSLSPTSAATLNKLRMDRGYEDEIRIASPILAAEGTAVIRIDPISSEYDRQTPMFYKLNASLLGNKPKHKLKATFTDSIDLGELLTEALRSEGSSMGLRIASGTGQTEAVRVRGTLNDIELEYVAAWMWYFYCYMDVDIVVEELNGETRTLRLKLHNYISVGRNSLERSLARFLIQSAQEIMALINREVIHAPPSSFATQIVDTLGANVRADQWNSLLLVALAGIRDAVPKLQELLTQEKDEEDRVHIANALAILSSSEDVGFLARHYETEEDVDVRYNVAKALAYIGSEESLSVLRAKGSQDEELAARRLASRYEE